MKRPLQQRINLGKLETAAIHTEKADFTQPIIRNAIKLFKPFSLTKKGDLRESFKGILFDKNGITATNGHVLLHVDDSKLPLNGLFYPDGSPNTYPFPDYVTLLENLKNGNLRYYEISIQPLKDYITQALENTVAPDFVTGFISYENNPIAYNGKLFLMVLNTLLSNGVTKAEFSFQMEKTTQQPLLIQAKFGKRKATILLMPIWMDKDMKEEILQGNANPRRENLPNLPGVFSFQMNKVINPSGNRHQGGLKRMEMEAEALELELVLELELLRL